ncbi:MAG: glycosyltransferase 87 family protein, partial [Anaerolineales bacterium]
MKRVSESMAAHRRRPFQNMTAEGWQNLALTAILIFYIAQCALDIQWGNMCGHLAIDYCSFWSAGRVASTRGYADVYNLNIMESVQRSVFPARYETGGTFATVPTPYLPIFVLPFSLLGFLGPFAGYWIWAILNLVVLLYYLRFFAIKMTGQPPSKRLMLLILLSLPVFLNFFYGQVNIWLTIFLGEYMRAAASGKPFKAGLWLAGLLLKPQYLILIGVAVLMQRSIKMLAG